jgi:hypothetical protein
MYQIDSMAAQEANAVKWCCSDGAKLPADISAEMRRTLRSSLGVINDHFNTPLPQQICEAVVLIKQDDGRE